MFKLLCTLMIMLLSGGCVIDVVYLDNDDDDDDDDDHHHHFPSINLDRITNSKWIWKSSHFMENNQ